MSAIGLGEFSLSVRPLLPEYFGNSYKRQPELLSKMFRMKTSENLFEEAALLSGGGLLVQTSDGEATPYDRMGQGYVVRYSHSDYRSGFIITQNLIDDSKALDIIEQKSKALGVAINETRNIIGTGVLNNAFSGGPVGGDNVSLVNTAHPTRAGNVSNSLTVAADLSEAALEQSDIQMQTIYDDRGLRLNMHPSSLVIPRASKFEAHRILQSPLRPSSADHDANANMEMGMYPGGVLVNDYLTSSIAWYILTNEDSQGLTWYTRKQAEFTDDVHFDTDNIKYKVHTRFSYGWTDFRHVFASVAV